MAQPVAAVQAMRIYFIAGLAVFAAAFFGHTGPAAAQIQTYVYSGPAFNVAFCETLLFTSPPCTSGAITASFTVNGVTSGYSGGVSASQVVQWSISSNSIMGSLGTGNYLNPGATGLTLTNGQVTASSFDAKTALGTGTDINSNGANEDAASYNNGISYVYQGFVQTPPYGIWFSPKSLGIACARPGAASCGEPIDLGSGNVFDQVTDYETVGQNKLSLIRYYNSMTTPNTYATCMGTNWRTNYDRYLHIINPSAILGVVAERPDGSFVNFTSNSGTYTPDSDVDLKLTLSGSTWTLTDQNDNSEIYFTSGSEGVLQSITQRNGYKQALTYSHGQIAFVSDSYARTLTFGYSSGLRSTVSTPEFTSGLTYSYVNFSSAATNLLSTVTYNTSPNTHQTYLYENTSYPYALTGITDENGNRYATWGYDSNGRGILSELSGAVNYTSVSYDDTTGNRIVKGPLGIVETYKFTPMQGVPKVTEIDRAANSPVAAATETIRYDANGYRNSLTDWNGNNTSWTNNSHGLPTQITFASATTNKQVSNLTYDLSWPHLPHTISTTGLNANFTYDSSGNKLTEKLTDTTSQSLPYSTNGTTRTWTYTYNRTGQVLTAKLPRTDVTAKTTYAYAGGTTGGTLLSITDALSHVTNVKTATGGGRPKKITDQNGIQTTLSWTLRNWLSSSVLNTSAGNLTTSLTYDSAGNLTKTTLPDGSYIATGYDNAHRPTSITNALGESQGITYDSAGDVTQTLWKALAHAAHIVRTNTYDQLNRLS
jgi:YD repeat-containing protein